MSELTYSQLLELPEWKEKRNVIIDRDKKTCMICNNSSYTENSQSFILYPGILKETERTKPQRISLKNSIYSYELYLDEIERLNLPKESYLMFYFDKIEEEEKIVACRTLSGTEIFEDNMKLLNTENLAPDLLSALKASHKDDKSYWAYAYSLQVHHTYYQVNKLPWEYPIESLQTLCFKCHSELHEDENNKIEVQDSNGIHFAYYTPCPRCNGSGYLPHFKHVDDGICYLCMDDKYLAPKFLKKI